MNSRAHRSANPWRIPAALAVSTLSGLLLALTGGAQPWRAIAWCLLGLPLFSGMQGWLRFRRL